MAGKTKSSKKSASGKSGNIKWTRASLSIGSVRRILAGHKGIRVK